MTSRYLLFAAGESIRPFLVYNPVNISVRQQSNGAEPEH
jgi:hypothetical protein